MKAFINLHNRLHVHSVFYFRFSSRTANNTIQNAFFTEPFGGKLYNLGIRVPGEDSSLNCWFKSTSSWGRAALHRNELQNISLLSGAAHPQIQIQLPSYSRQNFQGNDVLASTWDHEFQNLTLEKNPQLVFWQIIVEGWFSHIIHFRAPFWI